VLNGQKELVCNQQLFAQLSELGRRGSAKESPRGNQYGTERQGGREIRLMKGQAGKLLTGQIQTHGDEQPLMLQELSTMAEGR